MKQVEVEVKNFKLDYDGVYSIIFPTGGRLDAYLPLDTILNMLEIEGLKIDDITRIQPSQKPIEFKKVTLLINGFVNEEGDQGEVGTIEYETCEAGYFRDLDLCEFTIKSA
jgi:hypothetical protein